MALKRSIGRWALTGLMINSIIGSGIFGVPGELLRLLGPASPLAFLLAGLTVGVIVASRKSMAVANSPALRSSREHTLNATCP